MEAQQKLIEIQSLASGDVVKIQTYRFQGANRGAKAYIQANLHGAEIVGNAVIYQFQTVVFRLGHRLITKSVFV